MVNRSSNDNLVWIFIRFHLINHSFGESSFYVDKFQIFNDFAQQAQQERRQNAYHGERGLVNPAYTLIFCNYHAIYSDWEIEQTILFNNAAPVVRLSTSSRSLGQTNSGKYHLAQSPSNHS